VKKAGDACHEPLAEALAAVAGGELLGAIEPGSLQGLPVSRASMQ
jgi:hypothetical protein